MDRHHEHLIHTEGLFGQVAAMIGNHSMMQPEKPYSPYQFMPNYKRHADEDDEDDPPIKQTPEMKDAREDFQQRALQLAAEMKQGHGSLYDRICLGRTDG